ncbi:radical SAM protein [candidate division WOR-3 bacterium]|uniref:Radical SAM protein n=1 Tax=candidate division WOR-3 bacterium TaxID=2052148 RepID=A0A938BS65_UNCW3|nr:radical SAM protein [candidate division WOR-3 bacterium]
MKQPTAVILTAGCRLNQSESDALRHRLMLQGVAVVESPEEADTVYVNTCTVTGQADRSSNQLVRRACRTEHRPRVIVLGCLAERSPEQVRRIEGVGEVWSNEKKQAEIAGIDPAPVRSRAILKVQDGCDRRCSYCVVSGLRGEPRSVPASDVRKQFEQLLARGFHEVVLTGLNLGTYHDGDTTLAGLLDRLLEVCRDARIRLASVEPDTFDDDLVSAIADSRVCPHFHIPLQSGDDAVLAGMNRRYGTAEFGRLVERIIRIRPDVNIGMDVIVGYPGETEESFRRTRDYLARIPVCYLHVFPFSPRPGTEQGSDEPVRSQVARERVAELRVFSDRRRKEYQARFVGTARPSIVETTRTALTDNYLRLGLTRAGRFEPKALVSLLIGQEDAALTGGPC